MKFSKTLLLSFFFLLLANKSHAQNNPKWLNYSPIYLINTVAFEGNIAWLGTYGGGLLRIDTLTGQKTFFNGANSGISKNNIHSIFIDHLGNKWIVPESGGGLYKFDGTNWTDYHLSLSGKIIWDVFQIKESKNGDVYFQSRLADLNGFTIPDKLIKFDGSILSEVDSTENLKCFDIDTLGNPCIAGNGKVSWFNGNYWITYDTLPNGVFVNSVNRLKIDANNGLWFYSNLNAGTLFHFYNSTWRSHTLGPVDPNLSNIYEDTTGMWFYATYQNRIKKVYETTIIDFISKPAQNSNLINTDPSGRMWFSIFNTTGTGCILFEYTGANWKTYRFASEPFNYPFLSAVAIDKAGNKWIASNGLLKFDGFSWTNYLTSNSGIPCNDVRTVFIDHNDNVWITWGNCNISPGSLNMAKFDGVNWTTFQLPNSFNIGVGRIVEDSFGNLWMNSNGGLLKFDGSNWTIYDTQNSPIQSLHIWDLVIDKNDKLWFIPDGQGLLSFDGTNWAVYDSTNSPILNNHVEAIGVDCSNSVWLGSWNLGNSVLKFDGSSWTTFNFSGSLGFPYCLKNGCDSNGDFWIGFSDAISKYDGNSWVNYSIFNSGLTGMVEDFAFDDNNRLWIATMAGLCIFDEDGIDFDELHNIPPVTVSGNVFYDTNGNGTKEAATEPGLNHQKVKLMPGNNYTFTNPQGNYTFYCRPGLYKTQYAPYANWSLTTDSAFYTLYVDTIPQSGFNFGTSPTMLSEQADINMTSGSRRCSALTNYWINYKNSGTTLLNGKILFVRDTALVYYNSFPPVDSISGDTLIWNYNNLAPYDEQQIVIRLQNPPVNFSPANIVSSSAIMRFNQNGACSDTVAHVITCSFDPNEKAVIPEGIGNQHLTLMNETLEYTVHFENTGNDTAFTIYVLDTLDQNLDPTTFEVLSSSHQVSTNIDSNGLVMFRFNQINLLWTSLNATASQGFVKYSVKPRSGLAPNTVVKNTAHIFFDFNLAIKTNTVYNTLVNTILNVNGPRLTDDIEIYPNPADAYVKIDLGKENASAKLTLTDLLGTVIFDYGFVGQNFVMDTQQFKGGLYFITLVVDKKSVIKRKINIIH